MANNTAVKYNEAALERFRKGSLTDAIMRGQFDWTGAKSIVLTTNDLGSLADYTRSGIYRYGTPTELGNTQDTLTLTKDRAFSYTIDKRGRQEAALTNDAGATLARTIDQVIVPEIDAYRLAAVIAACPAAHKPSAAALTKSNAYAAFLALQEFLDEDRVPQVGRVMVATPAAINFLKQDTAFVKSGDLSQEMLVRGQIGEVDGVAIVKAPSAMLAGSGHTDMLLFHQDAVAAPVVLEEYKIHEDPPGISGWLVEGRICYDAFVLDTLVNGVAQYVHA